MIFLFLISLAINFLLPLGYIGLRISGVYFIYNRNDASAADDATDVVFSCVWMGVALLGAMLRALFSVSINLCGDHMLGVAMHRSSDPSFPERTLDLLGGAWRQLYTGDSIHRSNCYAGARFIFGRSANYLFDTAYYHLPLARIFETFGALKGLVALHANFGQTSTWFAIAAPGTVGGSWGGAFRRQIPRSRVSLPHMQALDF